MGKNFEINVLGHKIKNQKFSSIRSKNYLILKCKRQLKSRFIELTLKL